MSEVTTTVSDEIRTITIDDGRANALSVELLGEIHDAFDAAEAEPLTTIVTGREGFFSAGFDIKAKPETFPEMVELGARLAERMLRYPRPLIAAADGHGIAMGAFMLLSCDVRVGRTTGAKYGLNEVAIGLTVPHFGREIARWRLSPRYRERSLLTGEMYGPEEAVEAGFLDQLADPGEALETATGIAAAVKGVNVDAHAATKAAIRREVISGVREGIGVLRTVGFA